MFCAAHSTASAETASSPHAIADGGVPLATQARQSRLRHVTHEAGLIQFAAPRDAIEPRLRRSPIMADMTSAIASLVEVVLVVEDLERSLRFYRDTLGLEVISPPGVPAAFLRIGPPTNGIPQQIVLVSRPADMPPASGRRLHHIGLGVAAEAYETERVRLRGLGYALRGGEHPFMPIDAFYLDDPDGNEIEIATWRG